MNIIRYLLYARYFTYTTSLILYYNSMRLWQGFWGKNYHHLFWIRNGGSEGLSCLRFPNWVGLTWKLCMVHRADDLTRDTLEHDKQVVRAMEEYQSLNCKAVQDSDYTISLPICPMCSPLGLTHTHSLQQGTRQVAAETTSHRFYLQWVYRNLFLEAVVKYCFLSTFTCQASNMLERKSVMLLLPMKHFLL